MRGFLPVSAAILTLGLSTAALAQTTTPAPSTQPGAAPSDTMKPGTTTDKSATPGAAATPAPSTTAQTPSSTADSVMLTDSEAQAWIDKPVYTSDNKNVGEVAGFQRDSSGKVVEMHAAIGGFLGIGETRVKITPAQFELAGDRIKLSLTSEQVKSLPKMEK